MRTEKKNSKYFLNLEKRNFVRKKILKLKLSNGKETDDVKTILEEEKLIYSRRQSRLVFLEKPFYSFYIFKFAFTFAFLYICIMIIL